MFVEGPVEVLDHASPYPAYGSKVGIDATKKWPGEGHFRDWPDEIEMSREIKDLVTSRWPEYGIKTSNE
jgi:4-hydroxy-3-polyprenylbenzoate decarboxylase